MKRITLVLAGLALTVSACSAPAAPPSSPSAPVAPTSSPTPSASAPSASAPSASESAAPDLVLGADLSGWADKGFGEVRPSIIDFGRHSTTIVKGVTWTTWGDDEAIGTGTAAYVAEGASTAQATQETASVRLFEPGQCEGTPAYTRITWTFPDKPPVNVATFDACTGETIWS